MLDILKCKHLIFSDNFPLPNPQVIRQLLAANNCPYPTHVAIFASPSEHLAFRDLNSDVWGVVSIVPT